MALRCFGPLLRGTLLRGTLSGDKLLGGRLLGGGLLRGRLHGGSLLDFLLLELGPELRIRGPKVLIVAVQEVEFRLLLLRCSRGELVTQPDRLCPRLRGLIIGSSGGELLAQAICFRVGLVHVPVGACKCVACMLEMLLQLRDLHHQGAILLHCFLPVQLAVFLAELGCLETLCQRDDLLSEGVKFGCACFRSILRGLGIVERDFVHGVRGLHVVRGLFDFQTLGLIGLSDSGKSAFRGGGRYHRLRVRQIVAESRNDSIADGILQLGYLQAKIAS